MRHQYNRRTTQHYQPAEVRGEVKEVVPRMHSALFCIYFVFAICFVQLFLEKDKEEREEKERERERERERDLWIALSCFVLC